MKTTSHEGQSFEMVADLVLHAGEGVPTISIEAYSGGLMFPTINGKSVRAVIDLSGLQTPSQRLPILKHHDTQREVGHTESIINSGKTLTATGIASGSGPDTAQVVEAHKKKFPWKASVGVQILEAQQIEAGQSVRVNGRTIQGPFVLVAQSVLKEISVLSIGGDDATSVSIAANAAGVVPMDQIDPTVSATQVDAGAATASNTPQNEIVEGVNPVEPATLTANAAPVNVAPEVQAARKEIAAEARRVAKIQTLCANHAELMATAVEQGWTIDKTELELMKAKMPKSAPASIVRNPISTPDVLQAAFCMAGKLPDIEKRFSKETLDAADRQYRGGSAVSIQRLILEAAQAGGWQGSSFDLRTVTGLRGAMEHGFLKASHGFSTNSISNILAGVANKFLIQGYNFVENAWRQIATIRSVSDFKTYTNWRMTDGGVFEKVGPAGEIKHGTLGEASFTNRVETWAKMYGITRQDIINDDLGALTNIPQRLGRQAALSLVSAFWTEFLDDSSFFSNSTPDNLAAVALDASGLTTVEDQFNNLTDTEGQYLGSTPEILLVPSELYNTALGLMNSTVNITGATTPVGAANVFYQRYRVVTSRYLTDANAWYLLASPMDIPTIEVAFLNGVETPTIEQADADFHTLGILLRGYFDFGVALQDRRAGIKSNLS